MRVPLLLASLLLAACSASASTGDPAYKTGALGNGAFLFSCDDSVACAKWNDNAKEFPTLFTTGSTFRLTLVANVDPGSPYVAIGSTANPGVTLEAVGPYVGSGLDGFAALQPGYGTVVAHDRDGKVIDYVPLHIVVPDALVVYDAAYTGDHPPSVDALSLQNGDRPSYRTVGEVASEASAGSIRVAWTAADPTTLAIESYTDGVVTLHALRHGTTTLTAVGAALTKTITVDVQ